MAAPVPGHPLEKGRTSLMPASESSRKTQPGACKSDFTQVPWRRNLSVQAGRGIGRCLRQRHRCFGL